MPSTWYGPNPDRPPASPAAGDHEFDSALSGWSVIGTSGTRDANSTVESSLWLKGDGDGIYKSLATLGVSIPFTATLKVSAVKSLVAASVRTDVGLMIGEATPGKFIHGVLDIAEDDYMCICGSKWTNPSTFSTNIGDAWFAPSGSGAGSHARTGGVALMRPHWVRFVVNSSSNIDGYFSFDGILFSKWLTAYNPGFTVGSVGIDMHGANMEAAFDYLRFS